MKKQFVVMLDARCWGPFSSYEQADAYADGLKDGEFALVCPLTSPKKAKGK